MTANSKMLACLAASLLSMLASLYFLPSTSFANAEAVFLLILLFSYVNFCIFWTTLSSDIQPTAVLMWIYFGYFLILPGIAQVSRDDYPWTTGLIYDQGTVLVATVLMFVFFVSYNFGRTAGGRHAVTASRELLSSANYEPISLILALSIGSTMMGIF